MLRKILLLSFTVILCSCSSLKKLGAGDREVKGKEYSLSLKNSLQSKNLGALEISSEMGYRPVGSITKVEYAGLLGVKWNGKSVYKVYQYPTGNSVVFFQNLVRFKNTSDSALMMNNIASRVKVNGSRVRSKVIFAGEASHGEMLLPGDSIVGLIYISSPVELYKTSKGPITIELYNVPTKMSEAGEIKVRKNLKFKFMYSSKFRESSKRIEGELKGLSDREIQFLSNQAAIVNRGQNIFSTKLPEELTDLKVMERVGVSNTLEEQASALKLPSNSSAVWSEL